MRRTPWRYLGVLLVLSACQVPVETPKPEVSGKRLERSTPKASATPSVSPSDRAAPADAPSIAPSTAASVAASVAPAMPSLLQKPAGQSRLVTGKVAIDAHYAQAAGGGQIISQNGARAIAFGETSSLLGNNAGNLISNNGGALIGKVKAPVVGLVSNNGSGLISDKGLGYRVLQAEAVAVGVGEILPAAGLALRVFSLRTAALLPLGVDKDQKPVYEAYSNAKGEYQLYLSDAELDNVLLVASVPGGTDTRLDYSLVVPKEQSVQTLDEDTSLVANFLRKAFADVMFQDIELFFKEYERGLTPEQSAEGNGAEFPEFLREPAKQVRINIIKAALRVNAQNYNKRQKQIMAQRINDAVLASLKLADIKTDYKTYGLPDAETAALPALVDVLRSQRESVVKTFTRFATEGVDPAPYFAAKPYMQTVKDSLGVTFTIKTPADAIAFPAYGILANVQIERPEAMTLYEEVMTSTDYGMPAGTSKRVFAAAQPFYTAYLVALYLNPAVSEAVIKAVEQGVDEP
jgi:hypothetical protein